MIADIDPRQTSGWKRSDMGRLVRISEETKMAGFNSEAFGEKLKVEIAEQTQKII